MMRKILHKKGISLIFAIIVVTVVLVMVAGLNEITLRNLQRVGEIDASMQAQGAANSGFEDALLALGDCEAGCDVVDGSTMIEEDVIWAEYEIEGTAGLGDSGYYYVPIPGRGDAGIDCDADNPSIEVGDADTDDCNWNRIFYGQTVQIPLYVDGETMFGGDAGGNVFEIKVRTPNGEEIVCADGSSGYCDYDNDLVVMTWQIWGECGGVGCYAEGNSSSTSPDPLAPEDRYNSMFNSEIYTNLINIQSSVLNIGYEFQGSAEGNDIEAVLNNDIEYPVLHLAFVQTISSADNPLPYLEYQIVTDEPISSDRSFIYAKGYTVSKGEKFFWVKEGSYSQYTDSLVNFVFQN